MTVIVGILNVTRDSFSDGGRFFAVDAALAQAHALLEGGAAVIEVGAESTHPDSEDVPAAEEVRRLLPVVEALAAEGVEVSVDTRKPEVMRRVLAAGARWINDVGGMRDPRAIEAVAASPDARVVCMYSTAPAGRATREDAEDADVFGRVRDFLLERADVLARAGVARERVVADPGMGFFLGSRPGPSLAMLARLGELGDALGLPVLVSVSRKSFLGAVLGRAVAERGPATLAAEIWAADAGADYVRTHDARALADALAIRDAIRRAGRSP